MNIFTPREQDKKYQVAITFSTERTPIYALMPVREYRRMIKLFRQGKQTGTFEMIVDGHITEMTFPLQEMDTITAVPEVKENEQYSSDTSE